MAKKKKEEVIDQEVIETPDEQTQTLDVCDCDSIGTGMTQNFTIGLSELLSLEDIETRKLIIDDEINEET